MLEDKVTRSLSRICEQVGVCEGELPVITAPGVEHARYMHRDDGQHPVLVVLWGDGAISSCAFESDTVKEVSCCHTEINGGSEAFWAWVAHLSGVGYKAVPLEAD